MKRVVILFLLISLCAHSQVLSFQEITPTESDWPPRVFFQFEVEREGGNMERWTGCVTWGGSCLTIGPSIVADCKPNGATDWRPCNNEE